MDTLHFCLYREAEHGGWSTFGCLVPFWSRLCRRHWYSLWANQSRRICQNSKAIVGANKKSRRGAGSLEVYGAQAAAGLRPAAVASSRMPGSLCCSEVDELPERMKREGF